jgi:hypothetical protein
MEALISKTKELGRKLLRLFRSETGVVTIEWVALAAGMVIAAVAVSYVLESNTKSSAKSIGSGISGKATSVFGATGSKL